MALINLIQPLYCPSLPAPFFSFGIKFHSKSNTMKFLTDLTSRIPSHMDFEGQRRAERTFQLVLCIFGAAGLAWGYICQQFSQTVLILAAGFALSALLTLPPWPMYRRSQLRWQPVRPPPVEAEAKQIGRAKPSKKDK